MKEQKRQVKDSIQTEEFKEQVPELNKLQGNDRTTSKYNGWPDYSLHTDIADAAAQLKPTKKTRNTSKPKKKS